MRRFSFLVLLCSLAAGALASPLLLQKDCTKGSEVWCRNLQTASDCKAVKHCRQTVWNKPTVKSIPCDLCKEVVTVAGKVLKDNATEEEIYAYLTKACEFLSDKGLVAQCKEMVDSYLPNILDMIKEEIDNPEVVCSALTLCQSLQKHLAEIKLQKQLQSNKIPELDFSELASPFLANVPLLLYPQDKPKQKSQGNGKVCTDCIQLITDIQEAVRDNTTFVSSLIEHAKEECERLAPGFVDMCKLYISQYSDMAIQMMMHMQPEALCNMFGLCSSLKSVPFQALVPAKVISQAKVEPVEEEIVFEMEKICSVLPQKFKQECRDFVEVYGKSIIDMLLEATNPKMVCVLLKCCTDNALPAEKIVPVQTQVGALCDVCKLIVAYADKELAKNATSAEIEDFLERVCRFLPESFSDQCVQFVDEYEPQVVAILAQVMDPGFVCTSLGVCVTSSQHLLGTEVCVQGPGYWCKNMETASQCNAIEHCRRHVWN
ncbi:prosaposin-like isoform X2 [Elgaria multicarinata webbii]|uniref:prosaposin-like isoform X2 n=1 Tax=Elgaria multicarinata webbii TaxID=159646 RepID=UPI002FCD2260